MGDMPWRHETLMTRVLAHGADPDSVLHGNPTDLEGLEQSRHGSSIAGLDGQTRGGVLLGSEEWNALGRLVGDGMAALFRLCGCGSLGP